MIEGLFFRFFQITHMKALSIILSYLARFLFFLRFLLKRLMLKKEEVLIDSADAVSILDKTSPDPNTRPDYNMAEADPGLDLSVIVPVYNHVDIIGKCIDSLLNQKTHFRYEFLWMTARRMERLTTLSSIVPENRWF